MSDSRRRFLQRVIAAAAVTGATGEALALQGDAAARSQQYIKRLLTGLRLNEPFFNFWSISAAYPPRAGAVILNLETPEGGILRVDICQRGEKVIGPAATRDLEFFVMDGGNGKTEYTKEMKFALQFLADVLQENSAEYGLEQTLFTHAERLQHFPHAMASAACELVPTIVEGDW